MASNLLAGHADVRQVVNLVRDNQIDVLSLKEHRCSASGCADLGRSGVAVRIQRSVRSRRRSPARILAGDFNVTLDHATLRGLLDSGYADAAEQRGDGLVATWQDAGFPPPVAIDHVVAELIR
jgi:hypothetical protein